MSNVKFLNEDGVEWVIDKIKSSSANISDVDTLPTGNDIEDTFYRTKDSLIQIYFGNSLESSLAVFDEWIQNGYVTKDTIGDDTVIEAATGYSIYFVDSLGNKVAANSFKYTVESTLLSIYWYDTSDEEHFVGFINMTSGTPYYDNKYWCVPNVANNIYAGDSTAHTTTPMATSADIKTYTAGNGINITNDVISSESVIFTGTQEEWEQLSSADKAKYTHTCFTDDESGDSFQYSTTEQKTGKKWIDGKDIYCKVTYNANGIADNTELATNVDTMINAHGLWTNAENGNVFTAPYIEGDSSDGIGFRAKLQNHIITAQRIFNTSLVLKQIMWVVEYTKTTD